MTPPQGSPRPPRRPSASPAERSEEFLAIQRRLKQEAADRRDQPTEPAPEPAPDAEAHKP
jgi:hypothetical protein